MNATERLNQYLASYRARLKSVVLAQGVAITIVGFLLVCFIAGYFAISSGFASDVVWYGRLALLVVLVGGASLLVFYPIRKLNERLAQQIEKTSPEFAGRIQTFLSSKAESNNPMRSLLAEDALEIAAENPPEKSVARWRILFPSAVSGVALLVLLAGLFLAPGLMNYSLRHLLAGWMVNDLLPPQSIVVSPGDELVRRGSNLHLRADASGFQPAEASLFVKIGEGDREQDWQEVSMTRLSDNSVQDSAVGSSFDFTLFSVREPLVYYVMSMGIRSPNHQVEVIDLPGIKNLQVTYNYPEWTGLEPETLQQGGDIDALAGTGIALEIVTDSPLPAGELVLNGQPLAMDVEGESGSASFTVDADGEYFLAARIGSEQVRLSDDFFIRVLDDEKPEIEFSSPGRDRDASNIEEVATSIRVEDDYVLENVELRYAVNGGDWRRVSLSTEDRVAALDHTFYLEEITSEVIIEESVGDETELGRLAEEPPVPSEIQTRMESLIPGDLISYYAVAEDRNSQVQTDMYFIEVQPFDRRFSRAEQGGGGQGGNQGPTEQEISQRQKEIVISTWNLIREQSEISVTGEQERVTDNARLLASLQVSLQEQAQSLVETALSRRIDGDERVNTFIQHMQRAIEAMTPASESLAAIDLNTAIKPEQEALQHLLRADAVFNDIQVSLNQGGGGQGGGGAGEDLAEMMELEIDFEQNQYETGSQATRQSQEQETDDAMRELEELARRQEQLAENLRNAQQPTEAQQWQQEMLRRDAEELRERLEQLEQNAQTGQSQQAQGTQGESGQTQTNSDQAQAGSGQDAQAGSSSEASELNQRLESALDAMERASDAMRTGDADQLQQAAGEAQRQLEGAGSQIAEDQEASLQRDFADMAQRAEALHRDQARLEETLLDGVREAVALAPEGATTVKNPFTWDEEQEFAESKREMITELQRLKDDMQINADRVRNDQPRVSRLIDQADLDLKESEVAIRMDVAQDYMSSGESLYIANSESIVTRSLDELSETLDEAARAIASGRASESGLDQLLSGLRQGGEALREIAQNGGTEGDRSDQQQASSGGDNAPGDPNSSDQGSDSQSENAGAEQAQAGEGRGQGQGQGQGAAQEGQAGGGNQGAGSQGAGNQGGRRTANAGWDGWGRAPDGPIGDVETQLGQLTAGIGNLVPELRSRGIDENQIAEISQLVREIQNASLNGDASNREELNRTLALIEQLQQSVESGLSRDNGRVRSQTPDTIQLEYKEAIAEYYRRLSDDSASNDSSANESSENLR